MNNIADYAARYHRKFKVPLLTRVEELIVNYPNVSAPNFVSWEGEHDTGADTSAKLKRLKSALRRLPAPRYR